jgi:DNA-binding NtrC family response regulator
MDVLLIEDEDDLRTSLRDLLIEAGLQTEEAATAEDGLHHMAAQGPPSVIVTDLDLGPGIGGLMLAELVARQWPDVGIVFITGRPWLVEAYVLRPWHRFLAKPFWFGPLLEAVEDLRVLAGGRRMNQPAMEAACS